MYSFVDPQEESKEDENTLQVHVCDVKIKTEPTSPVSFEEDNSTSDSSRKRSASEMSEGEMSSESSPQLRQVFSPLKEDQAFKSSMELLQRIFPQQSRAILELILKASEEDVVRAIESLLPENNNNNTILSSLVSSRAPFVAGSETKSAFSPIAKSGPYLHPGNLPAHGPCIRSPNEKSPRTPSAFQPVHTYSPNEISPSIPDRFHFPAVSRYFYTHPATTALLSLNAVQQPNTSPQGPPQGSKYCAHCGFGIKTGDKFCCECGKCLIWLA